MLEKQARFVTGLDSMPADATRQRSRAERPKHTLLFSSIAFAGIRL
jgi:hypothetical protein